MKYNIPDAITTRGLSKYYGNFAGISDLDLSIKQGEIFGYLGPNGAGKTTTIRLFLGLIKPSSGEIWILGKNTKEFQNELSNSIGYLPGDLGLYRDMSGYDYLHHFMKLRRGKNNKESLSKLESLMSRFHISFDKKISTYSKGMKQVVGIIQAFMHNPQVVILDEPTSGLDPIMQEHFYEFLLDEKKSGKTIFFSSHILSEVEKICDRAGIIKNGKLLSIKQVTEYHNNIAKRVSIIPQGDLLQSSKLLDGLIGVKNIIIKNKKIEFLYLGDMQMLIQCVADMKIKDLVCEQPTLEEAFYDYYEE